MLQPFHYILWGHVTPTIAGLVRITRTELDGDQVTLIELLPTGATRLEWYSGRIADEEGWHSEGVTIEETPEGWLISGGSDGSDCDGRLSQSYDLISHGGTPIAPSKVSPTEEMSARQRDYQAEAAGY